MTLQEILQIAKEAEASDVLITTGIPPKMRVNGELVNILEEVLSPGDATDILHEVMNKRERAELESTGTCDFSFAVPGQGRYRVNVFKQRGSTAAAVRLVSWDIPSPISLEIPKEFMELHKKKKGLIVVSGASGSGRSNTLACFLDAVNENRNCHVVTLEDPIEFLHRHKRAIVNQREIGIDVANYREGLQDVMRENVDVVQIDEIDNDYKAINQVLGVVESGKMVLSVAHNKDVISTIERLLDVFPADRQKQVRVRLASCLRCVLTQQLLPSVNGGMVAAFELLIVSDEIRECIREGRLEEIKGIITDKQIEGFHPMDESIVKLFLDGKIDRDVAVSYAYHPEKMEKKI